ncbi:MAG TPA: HlyD family efflux transporter periplasmic adaptor subunit [Gemmataceae bacterium]|nr:HlyD family efflux transporter periplasmic adaptor subunit [Gemmataceae bacterium]
MLRRIVLLTAVGLAPLTAIACNEGPATTPVQATATAVADDDHNGRDASGVENPGAPLITHDFLPPKSTAHSGVQYDPIVVSNSRLGVIRKVDVSSQRDGMILFIGRPATQEEVRTLPPNRLKNVKTADGEKVYRLLHEGDWINAGDLVAQLDDRLARAEVLSKKAKIPAAKAAYDSAQKSRDEAKFRWERRESITRGITSVSNEDAAMAQITYYHMEAEAVKAKADIDVAKAEANQSETMLEMHQIHTEIPGYIQTIYKKAGEFVKASEPVLQVEDPTLVRAEAMVDLQNLSRVHFGMKVQIEQARSAGPEKTLARHLGPINAVAVSGDPNRPLVLSASDDGSVGVYDVRAGRSVGALRHPAGVRVKAVAASPFGVAGNWCITGGDDGKVRRWNLDQPGSQPQVFDSDDGHRQAIHAIAISPDGQICATGGDDLDLCFWDTTTGKLRWKVETAHLSTITSLQFTAGSQLLSAGNDNRLRRWVLGVNGAHCAMDYPGRTNSIPQLGATLDGKKVLFDQGDRLQVLSLADGVPEAVLQNSAGVGAFSTVALFSPDAHLILTAGAAEGRLQLWVTPAANERASQLRELVPPDHEKVACAAFAPDGSFLVTATRDHVMIWNVPTVEQQKPVTATVSLVDSIVDANYRQGRVWAQFENPDHRFMPGTTVTMIIPPAKR